MEGRERPTGHRRRVLRVPHGSAAAHLGPRQRLRAEARRRLHHVRRARLDPDQRLAAATTPTAAARSLQRRFSGDGVLQRFPCTRSTKAFPLLESVRCSRCDLFLNLLSHSEGVGGSSRERSTRGKGRPHEHAFRLGRARSRLVRGVRRTRGAAAPHRRRTRHSHLGRFPLRPIPAYGRSRLGEFPFRRINSRLRDEQPRLGGTVAERVVVAQREPQRNRNLRRAQRTPAGPTCSPLVPLKDFRGIGAFPLRHAHLATVARAHRREHQKRPQHALPQTKQTNTNKQTHKDEHKRTDTQTHSTSAYVGACASVRLQRPAARRSAGPVPCRPSAVPACTHRCGTASALAEGAPPAKAHKTTTPDAHAHIDTA